MKKPEYHHVLIQIIDPIEGYGEKVIECLCKSNIYIAKISDPLIKEQIVRKIDKDGKHEWFNKETGEPFDMDKLCSIRMHHVMEFNQYLNEDMEYEANVQYYGSDVVFRENGIYIMSGNEFISNAHVNDDTYYIRVYIDHSFADYLTLCGNDRYKAMKLLEWFEDIRKVDRFNITNLMISHFKPDRTAESIAASIVNFLSIYLASEVDGVEELLRLMNHQKEMKRLGEE